ncbi:hypothetical protein THAOC_33997 [Thalassiosira oceanica]|uniref:Uncharacterized protein n=1 Tax=Thalassiosira oceanica TaxID=159749 RepID=K0RKV5_THAOC|nr:hypothetical protein THAOC_33997 [Thalassiosira oceanica]|eukprot:EJK47292.1 hypothetical protein THAOC_33997 [Thalassiosira oceanica]
MALRSVTIPSTVTELCYEAFLHCSNLSKVIHLGGGRLLNQEFFSSGIPSELGPLNHGELNKAIAFGGCPVTTLKISTSWALSERIARLLPECKISIKERIRNPRRLELLQDDVLACFPVVSRTHAVDDSDTDVEDGFLFF